MALYTRAGNEIPSDAVRLSAEDALIFQQNIIFSWKNGSDVFYAKYGSGILAGMAAITGMYVNNYYRHRLRLQNFARLMTYFPTVIIPAVAAFSLHQKGIAEKVYIEQYQCPVCVEIKAASFQVMAGVLYPLGLAPISSFMMATRYHTYNMPSLTKDPRSLFKLYKKLTFPMVNVFLGITALQALITAFVTYKEEQNVATVKLKLMELEDEMNGSKVE